MAIAALALSLSVAGAPAALAGERIHIPRPTDVVAPPPPPPAVEPSRLDLPVTVSLSAIAAVVEEVFPPERAREESWVAAPESMGRPGLELKYYLWRGPAEVRTVDDAIEIGFPEFLYRVRGRLGAAGATGSCGSGEEEERRLELTLATRLAWADDGTVRSETKVASAGLPAPCRLGALDVDIMPGLRSLVEERLPALTERLDSAIEERSLSARRLSAFWERLARPVELRSRLWLTLAPSAISVSPLRASAADERMLESAIRIAIAPRAVKGEAPSETPKPLPRVEVVSADAANGDGEAGCHLAIPVAVPYDELNDVLRKQVVGQSFDVGPLGTVRVSSTLLYGSGDRLVMEIGVDGAVKGKIYAIGRPVVDADALLFHIEDVDLTVETRNVLLRAADAIAKDHLIAALEKATRYELKSRVEASGRGFEERLNREIVPGVTMQASDVRVTPLGVYPAPGGIEVQTVIDATIDLAVR